MRGIFCGITRIISGSEVYGPCQNDVCPSTNDVGIGRTVTFFHGLYVIDVLFTRTDTQELISIIYVRLELTFVYVRTYDYPRVDWMIYDMTVSSAKTPYAVVMNTGAWSFDTIARQHLNEEAKEYCNDSDTTTL